MHLRTTPDSRDRTILRINFDTIDSFLILDLTYLLGTFVGPSLSCSNSEVILFSPGYFGWGG